MIHILGLVLSLLYAAAVCISDWHKDLNLFLLLLFFLSSTYLFVSASVLSGFKNITKYAQLSELEFTWRGVFFWALIFRLIVFFDPFIDRQLLSSDVYRYLWEGKVVSAGENPYQLSPDRAELLDIKQKHTALWNKVDHKQLPTIYPPAAQFIFSSLPANTISLKILNLCWDLTSIWLLIVWLRLRKQRPEKVILYAWMPLSIIELGSSLHLEGLLIPWLILGCLLIDWGMYSRTQPRFTENSKDNFLKTVMIFFGFLSLMIAFLIKFVAIVPMFFAGVQVLRKKALSFFHFASMLLVLSLIGALFWIPFLDSENIIPLGFKAFSSHWRFNGAFFRILEFSFTETGLESNAALYSKLTALMLVAVTSLVCIFKHVHFVYSSIICFCLILLFSPVIYPWYLLWFLPLFCLIEKESYLMLLASFSCSVLISYEVLSHPNDWKLSPVLLASELLLPILITFLYVFFTKSSKELEGVYTKT